MTDKPTKQQATAIADEILDRWHRSFELSDNDEALKDLRVIAEICRAYAAQCDEVERMRGALKKIETLWNNSYRDIDPYGSVIGLVNETIGLCRALTESEQV